MKKYADLLLESMIQHNPGLLPLADSYAATENCRGGALLMMSCWKTVTGLNYIAQCFCDPVQGQLFVTANVDESGAEAIFYGRLKIENNLISELELFIIRARGDAGFVFLPAEMKKLPEGWTEPIPDGEKAGREELQALGNALFGDEGRVSFEASEKCVLMEMGGIVYEDPEYLETMTDDRIKSGTKEPVTIQAGLWPERPLDPDARVAVIDEEQGAVISFGVVPGYVSAYITANATASCFVPASMIDMHRKTLKDRNLSGRRVLKDIPAVGITAEMARYYSGKIHGMHRYVCVQGPGAVSPWV